MEDIEEFRNAERHKARGKSIFLIIFIILIIIQLFVGIKPLNGGERYSNFVSGFIQGICFAFAGLTLVSIIKIRRMLKNEKQLIRYYAECNDERIKQNCYKNASYTITIGIYSLLLAAIVASIFNALVFITILSCTIFMSVLSSIINLISLYKTKYEED